MYSPEDIARVQSRPGAKEWTERAIAQSEISELGRAVGSRRFGISVTKQLDEMVRNKQIDLAERNYALASTTPVLGQYAPTYGWPGSP